jgi:L-alanine-DL-glutamate epimerase-like enolase superfamily enzyme
VRDDQQYGAGFLRARRFAVGDGSRRWSPSMKITAIRAFPVWVGIRNQLIVKVETDEGIFGWGESGLSGREKAVMGAIEHYAEFAVGRDPFRIGALWQEMYRSQYFEGGRVLTAAISAIDIALHDIKGKALGVPVHQLLGGKQRDRIPTFATTRAPPGEEMIEQAKQLIAAGGPACAFRRAAMKAARSTSRASTSPHRRDGAARRARNSAATSCSASTTTTG